jgi:hypothetical protein
MEVREVVSGPGSQQLRHRDWPQRPMPSAKFKFCLAQIHRLEVGEANTWCRECRSRKQSSRPD